MLNYTICFIIKDKKVLLLNREKPGWMGCWNGVGGKLEKGETPHSSIIREIKEETGLEITDVIYKGNVTWYNDGKFYGGMYAFIAYCDSDLSFSTPIGTREGILDWKCIDWVLNTKNYGVAHNIHKFLPYMLNDNKLYNHKCYFNKSLLTSTEHEVLENDFSRVAGK